MGLGDRDHVVEIDGARSFHSVLLREEDLGRHTANGGGDGRHSNRGQVADGAVPREHDDRPIDDPADRRPIPGALSLPWGPGLDLILRYEISVQRQLAYAVNQLERLQRARKGEHVPAPVSVQVSGDQ